MKKHKPKQVGYDRMDRINDLIHRSIARILATDFQDPRIKANLVTIADVEVSRDLGHAKVYITVFDESKIKESLKILNNAASYFRTELSHSLKLRVVPHIKFIFDDSVLKGTRISNLLDKI